MDIDPLAQWSRKQPHLCMQIRRFARSSMLWCGGNLLPQALEKPKESPFFTTV